jgi:solute carrier family 25 phosphate transporter 3
MNYNESSDGGGTHHRRRVTSTSGWLIPYGGEASGSPIARRMERKYQHVMDQITSHRERMSLPQQQQQQLHSDQHQSQHHLYYYAQCFVGGGLSSSVRWVLTPLDQIKVSMQANPKQYPNFMTGLFTVYTHEGGIRALYRGLTPTILAYSTQSSVKYGMYEYLKDRIQMTLGPDVSTEYRTAIYVVSAGCAEAIADVLMCPWEMLKVKIQTSSSSSLTSSLGGIPHHPPQGPTLALTSITTARTTSSTTTSPSPSGPASSFPTKFKPAFQHMVQYRKEMNFPFGSLTPLWSRQVIGTIANFVTFEHTVNAMYSYLLTQYDESKDDGRYDQNINESERPKNRQRPPPSKNDLPISTQLAVTFAAGYVSGFVSTVVSHPADSLLSLRAKYPTMSYTQIVHHVGGWQTLATRGLIPRIGLTGTIIASQWLLYDSFKSIMGMGTSGS